MFQDQKPRMAVVKIKVRDRKGERDRKKRKDFARKVAKQCVDDIEERNKKRIIKLLE